MSEAFLATFWFWCAFYFSVGPWWLAYMDTAKRASARWLARNIAVWLVVGRIPFGVITAAITHALGGVHPLVFIGMHFLGGMYMLYLAYQTTVSSSGGGKTGGLNFDWKAMTLMTWSNPKSWLTQPAGFLAATYTDSAAVNIVIFTVLGILVFLAAAVLWAAVAKQGAKIAGDKRMSFAYAFLLAGFGMYLIWQGAVQ